MTLPEAKIPRKMSFRGFRELGGSRTHNLLGRNQVLYPLSYESLFILRGKGMECSLFMQEFRVFFQILFFMFEK